MRRLLFSCVMSLTVAVAACGSKSANPSAPSSTATPVTLAVNVEGLAIDGQFILPVGHTLYLGARATMSDGSQQDVGSEVVWASHNDAIARIAQRTLTALAAGSTTISATFGGKQSQVMLTVIAGGAGGGGATGGGSNGGGSAGGGSDNGIGSGSGGTADATVQSLAIAGSSALQVGVVAQLNAFAKRSDGSQQLVTSAASWSVADPSLLSLNASGQVTALANGSTTVTATYGGATASHPVTVSGGTSPNPNPNPNPTPVTVASVSVTGGTALTVGGQLQLNAVATMSDGSQMTVTSQAEWTTSHAPVATVSGGLVLGAAAGSATITAKYQSVSGSVSLQVSAAGPAPVSVVNLTVHGNVNLLVGGSTQLTVIAAMSDGTQVDVTASASFTSSNPLLARVSLSGNVSALLAGLCQITASYGGHSAQVQVTVTLPTLQSITIEGGATVKLLQTIQLTAIAHYSDGSTRDVTSDCTWTSGNLGLLGFLTQGLLRGLGLGDVLVTVAYQGQSAQKLIGITL